MPKQRDRFSRPITKLFDTDIEQLTDKQISKLDLIIHARRDAIKAGWSKEREAEARGVSFKLKRDYVEHDGRYFSPVETKLIREDDWEEDVEAADFD